jgi:erythromycin esterase-like protein
MASDALHDFTLFPRWLWRNAEMLDFLGWLRAYNDQFQADKHKVRLGGIDVEGPYKAVVWEHSRQAGDTRATDQGGTSVAQFARERHASRAVLVNFTTCAGMLVAASDDSAAPYRHVLPPAPPNSVEALCHAIEIPRFYLPLRGAPERLAEGLREPRLARMVPSVYRPENTSDSFMRARLVEQFDALVHFDATRPREPLDPTM